MPPGRVPGTSPWVLHAPGGFTPSQEWASLESVRAAEFPLGTSHSLFPWPGHLKELSFIFYWCLFLTSGQCFLSVWPAVCMWQFMLLSVSVWFKPLPFWLLPPLGLDIIMSNLCLHPPHCWPFLWWLYICCADRAEGPKVAPSPYLPECPPCPEGSLSLISALTPAHWFPFVQLLPSLFFFLK